MFQRLLQVALVGGLCAACPGSLQNRERFLVADAGGCDVETDIFKMQCALAGCHDAVTRSQGLDLESAGVKTRLRAGEAMCSGTPGLPVAPFILEKVKPSPSCGGQMPVGAPALDADELKCLSDYLAALDGGAP